MKKNLLTWIMAASLAVIMSLPALGQAGQPGAASPFPGDVEYLSAPPGGQYAGYNRNGGTYDALTDGADRLAATQYTDGSWGWPLNAPPTYGNILGPIAMGLAQAYAYTLDPVHLDALELAGDYLLTKTNNFSPSDGYLAAKLDEVLGGNTYVTHLNTNFYGPLAAGTYDRNGLGTLYTTQMYVNMIRSSRATQGIPNLAAWDAGMGLVGAASCGVTGTELDYWIDGVEGEIHELDELDDYDVVGLAGALYGLAFVDADFDPASGPHAAASSLEDLADILASYQINLGGFTWNSQYMTPGEGNETNQETAYAILALNEVDRTGYLANIYGAADYLISVQLTTGGWDGYVGDPYGENNEVTAEALWGLAAAYLQVHNVNQDLYYVAIQDAIDAALAGDVIEVAAGIFTEQLHITTNNLTISGAGKANTMVKAPATAMTGSYPSGSLNNYPVILVDGVTTVTIQDLTVDGDGKGNLNYRFNGIGFWNSGGYVSNVDVLRVIDTPFSGSQHGVGVAANNNTNGPYSIVCENMLIDDYQKNGMALSGNGLTVDLDNIITTGAGPTGVTAQNGIQVGFGAGGVITNCNVSGNIYTGTGAASCGILLYRGSELDMFNITATNNCPGINAEDNSGSLTGGFITNTDPSSEDGIYIRKYQDLSRSAGDEERLPSPLMEEYTYDPGLRTATYFDITDITVTGDMKADGWGVLFRANAGTLYATMTNSIVTGWDYGVVGRENGGILVSEVHNCDLGNNNYGYTIVGVSRAATDQDATDNWWGDPSGPNDPIANPTGQGSAVSANIIYAPYIDDPVDISIVNNECGVLEVIAVPSMPLDGMVTSLLFAVKWNEADYPDSFFDVFTDYNVSLQYYHTEGADKYAVFGTDLAEIDWEALIGDTLVTLVLKQNQPEGTTTDFVIADDAWTAANNAAYYFEFWGSDLTGVITGFADDVYLGSCNLELHAKVFLQGPYNTATDLMATSLNPALIPLLQPFNAEPWNYDGEEELTVIPTDMVDWVLVELRETATGAAFTQQAALLFQDGTIRSHINSSFDVYFDGEFMPNSDFFAVVYHRNHMPVMSAGAINIPNAGDVYDFSDMTLYPSYGGATAQVLLEAGVHGMISGDYVDLTLSASPYYTTTDDHLFDGILKYSGGNNDRAPIIKRIVAENDGLPYINNVASGYFNQDLTLNAQVKYSGSGNDQRLIILNLIELTGTYNLSATYASLVPGWATPPPPLESGSGNEGPLDIFMVENAASLEFMLVTRENLPESWTDNIQFTLSWNVANTMMDEVAFRFASAYNLAPQGSVQTDGSRRYITYAVVDWLPMPVPFNSGDQVTILTLDKGQWAGTPSRSTLAADAFTRAHNGDYYVSLIGQDKTGQILDAVTGIDDPAGNAILSLYPNPAVNGYVNLSLNPVADEILTITISDLSSRTVYSRQIEVRKNQAVIEQIDLGGLSKGIYFVRLQGTHTSKAGKVEIQ